MYTSVYICLPCLLVQVYLCLLMYTRVYLCLRLFTYVYNCLLVFITITITRVYRFIMYESTLGEKQWQSSQEGESLVS